MKTMREIFLSLAMQHYPKAKGFIWVSDADTREETVFNAAKEPIFTLGKKNKVTVHKREHLNKVNEIADFARLEKMVNEMG